MHPHLEAEDVTNIALFPAKNKLARRPRLGFPVRERALSSSAIDGIARRNEEFFTRSLNHDVRAAMFMHSSHAPGHIRPVPTDGRDHVPDMYARITEPISMPTHRALRCCGLLLLVTILALPLHAQKPMSEETRRSHAELVRRLSDAALNDGRAYAMLAELTSQIGPRLSGSPGAERAVEWGRRTMTAQGLDNVRLQPVWVPHWVRGDVERAAIIDPPSGTPAKLHICALGGSVATPKGGIEAEIVEVQSIEEAEELGEKGRGKIIFFNRPMNRKLLSTFDAYGDAVDQRVDGPDAGAKVGALAVLVRSMTTSIDTFPHTGMLRYSNGVERIPAAALSTADADRLSEMLRRGPVRVGLELTCATLPDVESANVLGEIRGSEFPNEVVVIGGHLDSWDIGEGAHDDGAGCVQAIEALRLLKSLGIKPKRTIRAVLYMNEENGLRGGNAYADSLQPGSERHIAAIESDRGGFAPRGFSVDGTDEQVTRLARWSPLFAELGAGGFVKGYGGADVAPLKKEGALPIGLIVESHRYFDYHHSAKDTFEKVNERELELGAVSMALLAYLISEEGKEGR